jgi:nucleotide-binding universal stress UspA family protein
MRPIRKILVPIDFSPHSAVALQYAIDIALHYSAELALVHVFDIGIYALGDGSPMLDPAHFENIVNQIEHDLDEAKRDALAAGVGVVHTKLLQGKPDHELQRSALEDGADLIVMGTHGRTGFRHLLMGSVAERLLRRAHCPVFTVKSTPATESLPHASHA